MSLKGCKRCYEVFYNAASATLSAVHLQQPRAGIYLHQLGQQQAGADLLFALTEHRVANKQASRWAARQTTAPVPELNLALKTSP